MDGCSQDQDVVPILERMAQKTMSTAAASSSQTNGAASSSAVLPKLNGVNTSHIARLAQSTRNRTNERQLDFKSFRSRMTDVSKTQTRSGASGVAELSRRVKQLEDNFQKQLVVSANLEKKCAEARNLNTRLSNHVRYAPPQAPSSSIKRLDANAKVQTRPLLPSSSTQPIFAVPALPPVRPSPSPPIAAALTTQTTSATTALPNSALKSERSPSQQQPPAKAARHSAVNGSVEVIDLGDSDDEESTSKNAPATVRCINASVPREIRSAPVGPSSNSQVGNSIAPKSSKPNQRVPIITFPAATFKAKDFSLEIKADWLESCRIKIAWDAAVVQDNRFGRPVRHRALFSVAVVESYLIYYTPDAKAGWTALLHNANSGVKAMDLPMECTISNATRRTMHFRVRAKLIDGSIGPISEPFQLC